MCSKTGSSGSRSLINISFTSFQRLSAASIYPASQLTTERCGIRSSFACTQGRLQSPPSKVLAAEASTAYRPDGGCSGELTGGIRLVMIRGWLKAFAGRHGIGVIQSRSKGAAAIAASTISLAAEGCAAIAA